MCEGSLPSCSRTLTPATLWEDRSWASTSARWGTTAGRRPRKEAAARRATERQILEDAEQLMTVWNKRQAKRMPMLFSPTIGAAITAG